MSIPERRDRCDGCRGRGDGWVITLKHTSAGLVMEHGMGRLTGGTYPVMAATSPRTRKAYEGIGNGTAVGDDSCLLSGVSDDRSFSK